MTEVKTLVMRFLTTGGKEVRLNVANPIPQANITTELVNTVGAAIVTNNIFVSDTGDFARFLGATLNTVTTTDLV